ncbi:hypothetical protein [Phenylobacterium soli]
MDLERRCEACSGHGFVRVAGRPLDCEVCEGRGAIATEAGRRVLDFLRRYAP